MKSWVRYSVAVYLGLLLAGTLIPVKPRVADGHNSRLSQPWYVEHTPINSVASASGNGSEFASELMDPAKGQGPDLISGLTVRPSVEHEQHGEKPATRAPVP